MKTQSRRPAWTTPGGWTAAVLVLLMAVGLAACQFNNNPPGPTSIPPTGTQTPAPSLTQANTTQPNVPVPSLAPIVTATGNSIAATSGPVALAATDIPTPAPYCYTAKAGDTIVSLITRAGYRDLTVWGETCAINSLPNNCSNIQVGKQYCIPHQTWTPSPPHYSDTQTALPKLLPSLLPTSSAIAYYPVVEGDNITTVVIKTGVSLRIICELNNPDPVNCAGCNLDAHIGQWGCAPRLVVGAKIKIPGPTPTPTITPTISGSETATPTPAYSVPQLVSPTNGSTVTGGAQLVWLPPAILQPDEYYLVLVSDVTSGVTREFDSQATSVRLPVDMQPASGQTHTVNWQVAIARKGPDGAEVLLSDRSLIYTFSWQG